MNRIFEGYAQTKPFSREVLIIEENRNTTILRPERSQRVKNHSPDGFNWGYGGSGPAQLALAILLEVTSDPEIALRYYHDFEQQVIAAIRPKKPTGRSRKTRSSNGLRRDKRRIPRTFNILPTL